MFFVLNNHQVLASLLETFKLKVTGCFKNIEFQLIIELNILRDFFMMCGISLSRAQQICRYIEFPLPFIISDTRKGCYMGLSTLIFFSFFLFSFFCHFCPAHISGNRYSQRLKIQCAAWSCGLIVHCCLLSNSLLYFFLFFFFFSAKILSGPYLWNRYSQRLQIECAAWSCGLILHCYLPSNSLRYLFFFSATILSGPYLWNRYSQKLQIDCAAWSCCLILHCCLPSNSLRYFFFPPRFYPGHSLR